MPIFIEKNKELKKQKALSIDKEKVLQELIEKNLMEVLDMHFLETEYVTTFGGRIDTLAIDTNGSPVIIEYKRNKNDNIINQGLSYLKWLQAQKVEFLEMLVQKRLGKELAERIKIDWKNPRIVCIAESYSKFDIDTVEVIPMRIELFKYRFYENSIFSLEPLNTTEQKSIESTEIDHPTKEPADYSLENLLKKATPPVVEAFYELRSRIIEIDENISERVRAWYVAFRIANSFAEVWVQKSKLKIYMRPIDYEDPQKKVERISDGYGWVLNKCVCVASVSDVDYAIQMIEQSYQDVI
jgi:predicted transport protein